MKSEQDGKAARHLFLSPGKSPRVEAIVAHLTPGERRRYRVYTVMAGGVFAIAISGLSPLLLFLILTLRYRMPALIGALAIYVGLLCLVLYGVQWMSANFLRQTGWSKAQGWDKETLR